jgi:menaquinone-dependent protoporphyrinogen oxidase
MKTLIIYSTKTGTVEECVTALMDILKGDITAIKIQRKAPKLALNPYNRIIIGASIHAGKIQGAIKKYCENHLEELKAKKLGIFLCCLTPQEEAKKYFKENFPIECVNYAQALGLFGAAVYFEKMNFIERFILKKITKKDKSYSLLNKKNIEEFAKQME